MSKERCGVCIFVENEFGVIQRVTNLFSARGINIESIHTTPLGSSSTKSQISITLYEDPSKIELIRKLLLRLIIVHEVQVVKTKQGTEYLTYVVNSKNAPSVSSGVQCFEAEDGLYCITGIATEVQTIIDISASLETIKIYTPF